MAFNFPSSPTVGQIYTPLPTVSYVWNGSGWDKTGATVGGISTKDTPPVPATPGQLWWESDTGRLFIYYDDGNSQQWVQINMDAPSQVRTADPYNFVVNGAMTVSQENGNTAGAPSGYYPSDQWVMLYGGSGIAGQTVRSAVSDGTGIIVQSFSAAKTTLAAADYCQNVTNIEGSDIIPALKWGTAAAIPAVVRVDARSDLPGIYTLGITSSGGDRSFLKGLNLTTAWQTFVIPIPAQTGGTWASGGVYSMMLRLITVSGGTYAGTEGWQAGDRISVPGQINGAAQTNLGIAFTKVGLYADPLGTGLAPPYVITPYATELARCQRYWQKFVAFISGYQAAGQGFSQSLSYPVNMRTAPAVAFPSISYANASGVRSIAAGTNSLVWDITAAATGTVVGNGTVVLNARM